MLKSFICLIAICSILSLGCCGPMMVGPGCGISNCYDCDGATVGQRTIPHSPLDSLRQLRRSITCGSGCGETYVGEWISTPPDCSDPCCGSQWVGGTSKCRPFCWEPGMFAGSIFGSLVGQRYCDRAQSSQPCGCDECSSYGYDSGMVYESGEVYSGPAMGGGCSSDHCQGGCGNGNYAQNQMPGTVRTASNSGVLTSRAMSRKVDYIRR
ncbi:MAG: hypothetical protein AAF623_05185 [Planctomycetota bacterium]